MPLVIVPKDPNASDTIQNLLADYEANRENPDWSASQHMGVMTADRIFVDKFYKSIFTFMRRKCKNVLNGIKKPVLPISSYLLRCLLDFYREVCRLCTIDPSHDVSHVMRVVHLAFNLASIEYPNMSHGAKIVLVMVALLHDCMDRKVVAVGARDIIRGKLREIGRVFGMPFDFVAVVEALLAILPYSARKNRPDSERYTVEFDAGVWANLAEYFQLGSVDAARYWFSAVIKMVTGADVIDAHLFPERVFTLSLNQINLPFGEWISNIAEVIRGPRIYGASDDEYATPFILSIIKCIRPALHAYCGRYLRNIVHVSGVNAMFSHRVVGENDRQMFKLHRDAMFMGNGMLGVVAINI